MSTKDFLKGRLILDCSALLPGPHLGKLLAELGARVLKIESPLRPDPARTMSPTAYHDLNERKERVELDLLSVDGRARFEEHVRSADGLIEGFRPSAKAKLGLDEKSLHAINPRLCIASLVGYPEDGPCRDRAGHNLNFEAVSGCLSLFKEMPALPLADLFSAYAGALELTAAMDAVSRTGAPGTRVVISMSETLKDVQSTVIREYRESGVLPQPEGNLFSGLYPCYRIYHAADGRRITVGAIERKFWEKFIGIIGLPELAEEGYQVGEKGQAVIARVQSALGAKPWSHWAPLFLAADCCIEPVLDYSEVYGV